MTTPGTIAVTLTPVKDPSVLAHGSASVVEPAFGVGRVVSVAPPKHGKIHLYSSVGDSAVEIDPKSKKHKGLRLVARTQKVWEAARDHIIKRDQHASKIVIKALPNTDEHHKDVVSISYMDGKGEVRYISQRDIPTEILAKVNKLRQLVRPNRTMQPSHPLHISQPGIIAKGSLGEFLKSDFEDFTAGLPDPTKKEALHNIVTTEAMIQGFQRHLNGLIDHQEKELEKMPLLPHPDYKLKKDELEKLRKLQKELEGIDRSAVFRAVATWGDLRTGEITPRIRADIRTAADKLSLDTKRDLQKKEKARQDGTWFKTVKGWVGKYIPLEPTEIHNYALGNGDLLLQDRFDYQARRGETERSDQVSCVEQLVVQMMMNLLDLDIKVQTDHPVLATFDASTSATLQTIIEEPLPPTGDPKFYPKAYARAVHAKLARDNPSQDLETRISAIKGLLGDAFRFDPPAKK